MTRKFKHTRDILIFFLLLFFSFNSVITAEEKKWVLGAEAFSLSRGQKESAVTKNLSENLPASIMEKLNDSQFRNVLPSEQLARTREKLSTERKSLFLQLSSAHKKRDAIFLNDYSDAKLKRKLKEENKNIKTIENSLKTNLESLKEAEENAQAKEEASIALTEKKESQENEFSKFSGLIKNIFKREENIISLEKISFYKDDVYSLFKASEAAKEAGYESKLFSKEVYSAGINALITGSFSLYGEYLSLSLLVYLYPEGKLIGAITEVGTIQDLELLANAVAGQLIPILSNALPVQVELVVNPPEIQSKSQLYIDDVLQRGNYSDIFFESGRHTIQIIAAGYENLSFSEFFDGNSKYRIEVSLEPKKDGAIHIALVKPLEGEIYLNGEKVEKLAPQNYIIQLNGSHALGEFISSDEQTDFFYIPDKLLKDGSNVKIKPKPMDRETYIDTRRKWMYAGYSLFMTSLIPYFYTYGNFINKAKLYNDYDSISYEEAAKWQSASKVCTGITIGCAVFWGFELVRYFMAANSVLPQRARETEPAESVNEPMETEQSQDK